MMTVATTMEVRGQWAEGVEVDDIVTVMMARMVITVGMTMEMGRGRERRIGQGVLTLMRKCQR
jgi:hypothetical protein